MKGKLKLDFRAWYLGHIVLLVAVAFLGGHWLQDQICKSSNFCIEQITPTWKMLLYNLGYYSFLAWIFDSLFHSYTGLD